MQGLLIDTLINIFSYVYFVPIVVAVHITEVFKIVILKVGQRGQIFPDF